MLTGWLFTKRGRGVELGATQKNADSCIIIVNFNYRASALNHSATLLLYKVSVNSSVLRSETKFILFSFPGRAASFERLHSGRGHGATKCDSASTEYPRIHHSVLH